jgi:hypothetical protein
MAKVIFYPNKDGSVAMILPMDNCGLTVEDIASKDTPAGRPYLIMERDQAPEDSLLDEWKPDFSSPSGIGIGQNQWFINKYQAEIATLDSQKDAELIESLNKSIAVQQAEKARRENEVEVLKVGA